MKQMILAGVSLALIACNPQSNLNDASNAGYSSGAPSASVTKTELSGEKAEAVFAGGCFWCVESDFEKLDGVYEAISGYSGGSTQTPDYQSVTYGDSGHYEAVKVIYDPQKITYRQLVDHFWYTIDPTDPNGQFCDKGASYKTAIFATSDQQSEALESLEVIKANKPFAAKIVTPVKPLLEFYDAEGYHQDYYIKNPVRYKRYRTGWRRDARLKALWGDKPG